jgi:copper chaperone NosL
VEGMSYQPPLIGYKELLNFLAYSGPDTGSWILIGGVGLLMIAIIRDRFEKIPQVI